MSEATPSTSTPSEPSKPKFHFPSAVTTLVIVTVLVWAAPLFIPAGRYATDTDGSPIPGTYGRIDLPLTMANGLSS